MSVSLAVSVNGLRSQSHWSLPYVGWRSVVASESLPSVLNTICA